MTASGKMGVEAFYVDEHGEEADADIRHPILDAVDDRKYRVRAAMGAVAP